MPRTSIFATMACLSCFAFATTALVPSPARAATQTDRNRILSTSLQERISATLGRDQVAYRAIAERDGFRMRNPKHQLTATFDRTGIVLQSSASKWRLKFAGFGQETHSTHNAVAPTAIDNRVEYRRENLTEWYVNGPLGIEQGFDIANPPADNRGPLMLHLALSSELTPTLDPDQRGLTLKKNNLPVLRYRNLQAHDSTGRELPARIELTGKDLLLQIDDAGARYPVTVDPIIEEAQLTASDGGAENNFGTSVAVSGNTVVVGASQANILSGEAYIFVQPASGWSGSLTESAKLFCLRWWRGR